MYRGGAGGKGHGFVAECQETQPCGGGAGSAAPYVALQQQGDPFTHFNSNLSTSASASWPSAMHLYNASSMNSMGYQYTPGSFSGDPWFGWDGGHWQQSNAWAQDPASHQADWQQQLDWQRADRTEDTWSQAKAHLALEHCQQGDAEQHADWTSAAGVVQHGAVSRGDFALARWRSLPAEESDSSREAALLHAVEELCREGRMVDAQATFLEMRELWRATQQRFASRGISFGQFNNPYQQAFRSLRQLAERLAPAKPRQLPDRQYIDLSSSGRSAHLRVMTFNVLSENLNDLFSYQFVVLPQNSGDFLKWSVREVMIEQEVSRSKPDLLCLQEVDFALESTVSDLLKRCGLQTTPLVRRNTRTPDGLCFAYSPSSLRLLGNVQSMALSPGGNAVLIGLFEVVMERNGAFGKRIACLTTHVAGKEPACTSEVMSGLVRALRDVSADVHILAGDLNGCVPDARACAEDAGFSSAYDAAGRRAMASGGTVVTAHNDEYHWSGELDFIFVDSASVQVAGVVQLPAEERLVSKRATSHPNESLPNAHWPSDHLSLIVDLHLT